LGSSTRVELSVVVSPLRRASTHPITQLPNWQFA
jgi:hypothetical protein